MLGEFFLIRGKILRLLEGLFKNSDIILDIGCGEKPYYHKSIKANIVCTDIRQTKKTQVICDAMSLPLKKSKFDGVICVSSLYYYKNPFQAIKQISNVLKKNGKLALVTPFIYPIHDAPYDKYRFTKYGLREILKNEFDVKKIKAIGGIFNLATVFFHSLIKGVPLIAPKSIRKTVSFLTIIVFYPFYIVAQLISLLDFLDRSDRWPTYYFTIATKK
ncbi:MAG: class I SAM-dependent methyltransferase [Nanoarchaeota archaeon]|nr:class I SAM-dependent methyltransferase [Nanoarchaeota archaeon]